MLPISQDIGRTAAVQGDTDEQSALPVIGGEAGRDLPREYGVTQTVPIVQEEAFLTKQLVETEQVRVRTSVEAEHVLVRDTVSREQIQVTHVAVDREVAVAPQVREENGVTIIPVLEERLVVEKRLFLVEEIHVRRTAAVEPVTLPTTLRRTRVDIEREDLTDKQETT